MNSLKSVLDEMDPDKLIRMLGYRKSRSQKLQEVTEVEAWAKKSTVPAIRKFQESKMQQKYWDLRRQEGWKSAKEKAIESKTKETSETVEESVDMTTIYEKVDKKHRRQSKKWNQEVEKELSLALEANDKEEEEGESE